MPNDVLPVAVIGVGGFGQQTLQALRQVATVRIVGVSDRDATVAAKAGQEAGVPYYSDNRSLLAEARPQAVFLAVPPAAAAELLVACAERGIHVWKELPLARNLAEGVAMVQRMDAAGLRLAVGTQRRFTPGYQRARDLCSAVEPVFLARAHYLFNWGPNLSWRADKASAGGGALLELGYHPIDLLVWLLGLPEEVYGASAGGGRGGLRIEGEKLCPVYDTDDTAAAIFRYARGSMATVVTTRASGPVSESLCLHGRGGSLIATAESCLLRDPDGKVLDHLEQAAPPTEVFRRQAEAFVRAVTTKSRFYECSGRENLLNLSVIESIYLSDRTSQPEHPLRLLKTHGLSVEECLKYCGAT
jgi:predicted dehydrogenase